MVFFLHQQQLDYSTTTVILYYSCYKEVHLLVALKLCQWVISYYSTRLLVLQYSNTRLLVLQYSTQATLSLVQHILDYQYCTVVLMYTTTTLRLGQLVDCLYSQQCSDHEQVESLQFLNFRSNYASKLIYAEISIYNVKTIETI